MPPGRALKFIILVWPMGSNGDIAQVKHIMQCVSRNIVWIAWEVLKLAGRCFERSLAVCTGHRKRFFSVSVCTTVGLVHPKQGSSLNVFEACKEPPSLRYNDVGKIQNVPASIMQCDNVCRG